MSSQQALTHPTRRSGPIRRTASTPQASTFLRRRLALAGMLAVLVVSLLLATGWVGAEADVVDPVAGHVVVAPGETLWDVAVATAESGVDPRRQLDALRDLNGIDGSHVAAWDVILVPVG